MNSSEYNVPKSAVSEFMRQRRSVPAKFMGAPGPDEAQLREILEIAMRVPDHGKLAPWRFVQYSANKCADLGDKIAARAIAIGEEQGRPLTPDMVEIERTRFVRAPLVIGVVCCAKEHVKIPIWEQELSSGAVAMNMLIAANAAGFDAQWISEWVAYDDALRPEFGLETGERITGFIHMGTRQQPKSERDRPLLDAKLTLMVE